MTHLSISSSKHIIQLEEPDMDLRIQKTRQNIFQAFIELREKYPLEKITVKELTERAQISKQTFYLHYRDMYDLSERIEQSMIQEMLKELPYPENILTHKAVVPESDRSGA